MDLIKVAEEAFATGKQHPSFKAGDTITVAYKIIEGSKERIQLFRGVVIKINGHQEKKSVSSLWSHPTLRALRSTRLVRFVALSCTTCATSPVRLLVSRRSVAVLVLLQSKLQPYTSIKRSGSLMSYFFLFFF